jgi:hypothetical protein
MIEINAELLGWNIEGEILLVEIKLGVWWLHKSQTFPWKSATKNNFDQVYYTVHMTP